MASGLTFNVPDEDERASDRSLPAGSVDFEVISALIDG